MYTNHENNNLTKLKYTDNSSSKNWNLKEQGYSTEKLYFPKNLANKNI